MSSYHEQMAGFSWEKRPLKRAKLGPPDVYPQDPKQKEDELTALNVKQGFSHIPQISDEFGTAKNCNISAAKLGAFINGAISRKIELNVLPDSGKRRLQVNTKDHFWSVVPRSKHIVEAWMRDLAGTKPLSALAKKVPIFNKREEIFLALAEHSVPMVRAAWFLKMTASYNSAISEAKTKKRQMPDPSQEWTISLQRCLKDLLIRLIDWYNGGTGAPPPSSSSTTPTQPGKSEPGYSSLSNPSGTSSSSMTNTSSTTPSSTMDDGNLCLRQWTYCTDLAKHLYQEGLLDRSEWLIWVLEACERAKTLEDGTWKALIPQLLSYLPDIAQSEFFARRLAYLAARRLSVLFQDFEQSNLSTGTPVPPPQALIEHLNCQAHRTTVLALVSCLQVITLECPTALVLNGNPSSSGDVRNSVPPGSPLDIIVIQPSALPMAPRANNPTIRAQLRAAEEKIRQRSRAVEVKWSCEEWQYSSAGKTLEKVLKALDALDRHSFDKVEFDNSLETLYSKVFPDPPVKDNPEADAPIVLLLCQWAVGPQRCGEHRALAVARLLEHRQSDATSMIVSESENQQQQQQQNGSTGEGNENGIKNSTTTGGGSGDSMNMSTEDINMNGPDSVGPNTSNTNNNNNNNSSGNVNGETNGNTSNSGSRSGHEDEGDTYSGLPIYHNLLFKFLDTDAPTLDESSPQSKTTFASLVHLFGALIRHDIFSHDAYLCTLVARGDLSSIPQSINSSTNIGSAPSVQPIQSVATPGPGSHPGSVPGGLHGPATPASVSSITPHSTPHHDLIDDRGPLFPPLPRMQEMPRQPDYDDRNIDDDLDRILQHITQEQQNNMDQVDSPKEDNPNGGSSGGFGSTPSHQSNNHSNANPSNSNGVMDTNSNSATNKVTNGTTAPTSASSEASKQSRHRLFVMHFPLIPDESYQHEANQRHILLYGVGRSRDEARHVVKKVSKDLGKLFSKKFCYDIADGSRVKKHSKTETTPSKPESGSGSGSLMDSLQARFCALPYFDQHAVTSFTAQSVVEMLSSFSSGRSNYLPTVEHIAFLTELMEVALHISGLLETCVQMLRELPDIESQLIAKSSPIVGTYTTSLELQLVAILRRYHCSLLLDTEMTIMAWENLARLMRRLTSTYECTSAERCALAYVTEMQTCCNYLRSKNSSEFLTPVAMKIRQSLSINIQPAEVPQKWNKAFMTSCLDNPRRKVEYALVRQLVDSPACRYSFVCNAILSICNEADTERLNDLASLCAETTAACPSLASEWLGVLQYLCCGAKFNSPYGEIFTEIDVKHLSIHSSLATLTALLVARQCFSLQDFVLQAVPSLLKAWNEGGGPSDADAEAGARLTCSLLLSLFKAQEIPNTNSSPGVLKLSCDRRLLSATHNSITLGAVLAVLKAMLLLADAAGSGERRRDQRNISGMSQGDLSLSHILGTSDVPSERCDAVRGEPRTLASFAFNCLQQMCSEAWVRQRCLQCPDEMCKTDDMLLDPIVSPRQAQRLLHLICYPDMPLPEDRLDPKTHIPRIMEGLDQWNLREAWLALTLQNKQLANNPMEYSSWQDIVARAALDVFHLGGDDGQDFLVSHPASPTPGKSPRSGKKSQEQQIAKTPPASNGNLYNHRLANGDSNSDKQQSGKNSTTAWLVASLLETLSPHVQGRVLKHAGNVLENTLWTKVPSKKKSSVEIPRGNLQQYLPFLSLILSCLRGQDEQREGLLQSLLNQFTQLLAHSKDPEADKKKEVLRDALRLRLNLVGGLFDTIQRSTSATQEWAIVLTQLVTHSVIDLYNNSDVFPTILDMVTALVHSTQTTESGERVEDTRKQNMNLIKKLKKELTDRNSESIKPLRQLLPFPKAQADVVVTQPTSTIIDSRGNRVQSFEFVDKKPGLQVWEKQRVSPWELLEGQRNPAPMSWAWFGAVKMERKPLRYEDSHRLLKYHSHGLLRPQSHYLENPPLPPEEIDMKPEIIIKEEPLSVKPDTPCSDQSPRGPPLVHGLVPLGPTKRPKPPRKKRQTKAQQQQAAAAAAAAAQQQQMGPVIPPPPPQQLPPPPPQVQQPQQIQQQQPQVQVQQQQQVPPPINPVNQIPNAPPVRPSSPFGGPQMGVNQNPSNYPPGPPPQWFTSGSQQSYYPGSQPGVRPQAKQGVHALQNLLRARHPTAGVPSGPVPSQFQQQQQQAPPPSQQQQQQQPPQQNQQQFPSQGQTTAAPQRHQILRTQLRAQAPGPPMQNQQQFQGIVQNPNTNQIMYSQQQQQQQQQQQMQQQQGINPNYGGYGGGPMSTQGSMPNMPAPGSMSMAQHNQQQQQQQQQQMQQQMSGVPRPISGPTVPEMSNFMNPTGRGIPQRGFMQQQQQQPQQQQGNPTGPVMNPGMQGNYRMNPMAQGVMYSQQQQIPQAPIQQQQQHHGMNQSGYGGYGGPPQGPGGVGMGPTRGLNPGQQQQQQMMMQQQQQQQNLGQRPPVYYK